MATREQIYTAKILINDEEAVSKLKNMKQQLAAVKKRRDEALRDGKVDVWRAANKEVEKLERNIDKQKTLVQGLNNTLDNMSTAKQKELEQTVRAINRQLNSGAVERNSKEWKDLNAVLRDANTELQAIKDEAKAVGKESRWSWLNKFNALGMAFGPSNGITQFFGEMADKMSDLADESIRLAEEAEGVEMAFERIDKPGMLENLRNATHGTVADLELMKQAVKFEDFQLPTEQLGTFLAYAQQKAKDTGESIDYLVNSIVTGLGRKSLPILDNLGLSATEIREEMKSTGDMTKAVANIIQKNMAAAGDYVETAADRAARATAQQQNAMAELGKELLPVKESIGAVFNSITVGAVGALKWLVQHRKIVYTVIAAVAAYTVTVKAAIIATKAQAAATWLAEKAQKAFNLAMKANPWGLVAAGVAAAVVALTSFAKKTKEISSSVEALQHAEEELNRQYVEQESKIRVLDRVLHDNNQSLEERRSALMRLKEIIPGYNAMLSQEGELIRDNRDAIEDYLKSLKKEILIKVYKDEIAEIIKKQEELKKQQEALIESYNATTLNGQTVYSPRFKNVQDLKKYTQLGEELLDLDNTINDMMKKISEASISGLNDAVEGSREYWEEQFNERKKYYESLKKDSTEAADALKSLQEAERMLAQFNTYHPSTGGGGSTTKASPYETDLRQLEENQKQALYILRLNHQEGKMTDEEYHKKVYETDMRFLQQRLELQERYGQSQIDTQNDILTRIASEAERQLRAQQQQLQTVLADTESAYQADCMAMQELFLKGYIANEEEYNRKKLETERDYHKQRLAIIRQYGGETQEAEGTVMQDEFNRLIQDRKKRLEEFEKKLKNATTAGEKNSINDAMYAQELITFEQYQQRKVEIAQTAAEKQRQINEQLYQEIQSTMQAASSMFSQMQSAEVAEVESRYDKQISAAQKAGKNTAKLEAKKEKEVAAIKAKYADREFQMKVLQIIADTAVGIAKLWKDPGYPWAIPLTALVAAQGAMQLATAKKAQQQAKKGYYEGGFTGGSRYRKEAGVVHEGEFVANHQAVNNPQLMPVLSLIDQAQRSNRVASLRAEDVTNVMGAGAGASPSGVIAPIVNVQTDNEELRQAVEAHREATELLLQRLEQPINAQVVLTGPDGLNAQQQRLDAMMKNK